MVSNNSPAALKAELVRFFHERWESAVRCYTRPAENYHELCQEVCDEAQRLFREEFAPLAHRIVEVTGPDNYPWDLPKPPHWALQGRSQTDALEAFFGTDRPIEAARRCLHWGAILYDRRQRHASRAMERAVLDWASRLVIDLNGRIRTFGQAIEVVVESFDVLAARVLEKQGHLVTCLQLADGLLVSVGTLRNIMYTEGKKGRPAPAPVAGGEGRGMQKYYDYYDFRKWLLSVRPKYAGNLPERYGDFLAKIQIVQS